MLNAEQLQNFDVLNRLRHYRVVGGHDQQGNVDPGRARHHGAHKFFVTRHVNHAKPRVADGEYGKAQLDRHAATLFLGQTIGVDTGERANQRSLAVVDMSGRAKYEVSRC